MNVNALMFNSPDIRFAPGDIVWFKTGIDSNNLKNWKCGRIAQIKFSGDITHFSKSQLDEGVDLRVKYVIAYRPTENGPFKKYTRDYWSVYTEDEKKAVIQDKQLRIQQRIAELQDTLCE